MASEMSDGCSVSRTMTSRLIAALEDPYAPAERWMYLVMEARPVEMTAKMCAPDGEARRPSVLTFQWSRNCEAGVVATGP
jgi:hypothetical protein